MDSSIIANLDPSPHPSPSDPGCFIWVAAWPSPYLNGACKDLSKEKIMEVMHGEAEAQLGKLRMSVEVLYPEVQHPELRVFLLDGVKELDYQPRAWQASRDWIPTSNHPQELLRLLKHKKVTCCFVVGLNGLGSNLTGLLHLLQGKDMQIRFGIMTSNDDGHYVRVEAKDLCAAIQKIQPFPGKASQLVNELYKDAKFRMAHYLSIVEATLPGFLKDQTSFGERLEHLIRERDLFKPSDRAMACLLADCELPSLLNTSAAWANHVLDEHVDIFNPTGCLIATCPDAPHYLASVKELRKHFQTLIHDGLICTLRLCTEFGKRFKGPRDYARHVEDLHPTNEDEEIFSRATAIEEMSDGDEEAEIWQESDYEESGNGSDA